MLRYGCSGKRSVKALVKFESLIEIVDGLLFISKNIEKHAIVAWECLGELINAISLL